MIYPLTFFQCVSLHMQALVEEVYDLEKMDKATWAERQAQAIQEPRLKPSLDKGWCQSRGDPNSGLTVLRCGQAAWGFGAASHDHVGSVLGLSLTSYGILSLDSNFSRPTFSHLYHGNNKVYRMGIMKRQ